MSVEEKPFASVATTTNQRHVATVLQNVGTTSNAAFNTMVDDILWTPAGQEAQVRQSFQSLSGETSVNLPRVTYNTTQMLNRQFNNRMDVYNTAGSLKSDRARWGELPTASNDKGYKGCCQQNRVWMYALGMTGDTNGDGNSGGFKDDTKGLVLGMDRRVSPQWVVGLGGAYTESEVNFDAARDKGTIDTVYFNAYARYNVSRYTVKGIVGYGHSRYEMQRYVTVGNQSYTPKGDTSGDQVYSSVEGSYRIPLSSTTALSPVAGVNAGWLKRGAYTETEGGPANLRLNSDIMYSTSTDLGLRFSHDINLSLGRLRLEATALWNHQFGDTSTKASSTFVAAPEASFDVTGVKINRDSAVLGAGLVYEVNKTLQLHLNYDAQILDKSDVSQAVLGGLQLRF